MTGLLNFACAVVVPGRAFLSRLIDLTLGIRSPHFRIPFSQAVKEDLRVRQQFLPGFNMRTIFLSELWYNSHQLKLFTDASGAIGLEASKYRNFGILSDRCFVPTMRH